MIHRLQATFLIIDNIGMLSQLYKYAYITYVGGGFTKRRGPQCFGGCGLWQTGSVRKQLSKVQRSGRPGKGRWRQSFSDASRNYTRP